jgi:hypothetical protein
MSIPEAQKEFLVESKEGFRVAWLVALWVDWSANGLRRHHLRRRRRRSRENRCASAVS